MSTRKSQIFRHYMRSHQENSKHKKLLLNFKSRVQIPPTIVVLSYKCLYDDYFRVNPTNLLKGIPTFDALTLILKMEQQVHWSMHDQEQERKILYWFVDKLPLEDKKLVETYLNDLSSDLTFINAIGTQRFVRLALSCFDETDEGRELTSQDYLQIFKAYLYCNQLWTNEQAGKDFWQYNDLIDRSLLVDVPISEFKLYKDFKPQLYKTIRLFEFAEKNSFFNPILAKFYEKKNVKSWKEYVSRLFSLFRVIIENPLIDYNTIPEEDKQIFQEYLIDKGELPTKDNLKKEIPKSYRNEFLLLNKNEQFMLVLDADVLIDKIYQGIKFEFAAIAVELGILQEKKAQIEINAKLGNDFAEHQILYPLMELVFADKKYHRHPGETTKCYFEKHNGSEPDYYMRMEDKLLLIENKDVLMNKDNKHSQSLLSLKESISSKLSRYGRFAKPSSSKNNLKKKKFDMAKKISKEGLGQLAYNIFRIVKQPELFTSFDADVTSVKTIYPILITYDKAYSANGVNAYIIKKAHKIYERIWHFNQNPNKEPFYKLIETKKPVIIDIDTLITYAFLFKYDQINLIEALDNYTQNGIHLSSFYLEMVDKYKNVLAEVLEESNHLLFPELESDEAV